MSTDDDVSPADPLVPGAWSLLGTPLAASIMAGLGADWLVLDAQHGLYDDAAMVVSLGALTAPGHPGRTERVLVRVPSNNPVWIGRALDAGATGVLVPLVQDESDAERAARACRYSPDGVRSWGSWSAGWGVPPAEPTVANAGVMCAVMVETPSALERVAAIAAAPGIDMVFVGPFDLSIALGTTHDALLADTSPDAPLTRVVDACRRAGVPAGAYAGSPEAARILRRHGFSWIAVVTDTIVLTAVGADQVQAARDGG